MKLFIFKTIFVSICFLILFQITIGSQIKEFKEEINYLKSQKNISLIKDKARKELRSAIKKENYLNPEDAKLINEFLNKIKKELENSN